MLTKPCLLKPNGWNRIPGRLGPSSHRSDLCFFWAPRPSLNEPIDYLGFDIPNVWGCWLRLGLLRPPSNPSIFCRTQGRDRTGIERDLVKRLKPRKSDPRGAIASRRTASDGKNGSKIMSRSLTEHGLAYTDPSSGLNRRVHVKRIVD
jgi:hypothetical protein